MALRILPFRQYAEQDVINLYALDGASVNAQLDTKGNGDAGVFVAISGGALNDGPVQYENSTYLGKTDYPHIGRDQYPVNVLRVGAARTGDSVLGMTLNQTATHDENGEKLLYYPQKALENQAVLSGQAVPVLTRGVVTLAGGTGTSVGGSFGNNAYIDDANWTIGNKLVIAVGGQGKVSGQAQVTDPGQQNLGTILATGSRTAVATEDQFAGAAGSVGAYSIVKINCAL